MVTERLKNNQVYLLTKYIKKSVLLGVAVRLSYRMHGA